MPAGSDPSKNPILLSSSAFRATPAGIAAIRIGGAIVDPLLEPKALGPDPGMPTANHIGGCRLCARIVDLTYEHIPPRSAGNASRRRAATLWHAHSEAEPGAFPRRGWTSLQRGVGAAVLCKDCNNTTGLRLVPGYAELANAALDVVHASARVVGDRLHSAREVDLTIVDQRLGAAAREALVMLLAASGGVAVTSRWPELRQLIFGETGTLPNELILSLRLLVGSRSRTCPPTAMFDDGGRVEAFIEVAHSPFAWHLNLAQAGQAPTAFDGADVSSWLAWAPAERSSTRLTLPVGVVTTPYPGDFRDPATVRIEIESSSGHTTPGAGNA